MTPEQRARLERCAEGQADNAALQGVRAGDLRAALAALDARPALGREEVVKIGEAVRVAVAAAWALCEWTDEGEQERSEQAEQWAALRDALDGLDTLIDAADEAGDAPHAVTMLLRLLAPSGAPEGWREVEKALRAWFDAQTGRNVSDLYLACQRYFKAPWVDPDEDDDLAALEEAGHG